jgi:two-component system, chemotaxis family, chemotaxis protein CheY
MPMKPGIKILLVDDMATMLKIQKSMLKKLGMDNIIEAKDGIPAWAELEKAHAEGTPIEFVMSDWNMPGLTGIDLLRKVRADERFKSIPFLMVTAESEQANVVEAVKAGVSNYIVKPFTPDTLKQKLDKIFP